MFGVTTLNNISLKPRNEAIRAKTAREVAVKLGPTFIKLGQALSIRCVFLHLEVGRLTI